MRITIKVALLFASIWISIRLIFFFSNSIEMSLVAPTLLNIFCLLGAITVGLFLQKRRDIEETNTMIDLKNAMTSGVIYSVIVSAFLYLYYTRIDPEYIERKIAKNEIEIHNLITNKHKLAQFKKAHPDAEVMTDQQIEKRLIESNLQGASAGYTSTLATLALLVLSAFYSIMITIIMRKVVFRN